jgi:DNA-binding FadR family transcriptional regulator
MVKAEIRRQEVAQHRKIAEAIRRRDGIGAGQAMREHLLGVQDDLSAFLA